MLNSLNKISFFEQLYNQKDRQMILADMIEYIILGRGFYSIGSRKNNIDSKKDFIKGILHFVNLLMSYESITNNYTRRKLLLEKLAKELKGIENEDYFLRLSKYQKNIGIPKSGAPGQLEKYFDKILPKTAGGLWHELLVYVFLMRYDVGYILPLLLHQRLYSLRDHIVPPDFLLITFDKRVFGIEVGRKKEIQSGSFSLKTAIPTASIDTENSRNSDRCPICLNWIAICPHVINIFSNLDIDLNKKMTKINCARDGCTRYTPEQIFKGDCKYSKYSRKKGKTLEYTHHEFADGKHYHYSCVLSQVTTQQKNKIIKATDEVAIISHLPFYSGVEELIGG